MKKTLAFIVFTTMILPVYAADKPHMYGDIKKIQNTATVVNPDASKKLTDDANKELADTEKKLDENIQKTEVKKDEIQEELNKDKKEIKKSEVKSTEKTIEKNYSADDEDYSEIKPEAKFPHGLQLGLGMSATSGVNGFVGYANKKFDSFWWKRIGGRLDFATTSPIKSALNSAINSAVSDGQQIGDDNDGGGITIDSASLSANHFAALVDFYPFGNTWFLGGWRLTGGYMFGKLDLRAGLTSTNNGGLPTDPMEFEINDVQYRYDGGEMNGTAEAKWKYSGPYLGTGFDLGILWGIKIYMDAGVVFTNKTASVGLDVPITDKLEYWDGSTWQPVALDSDLITDFESNKRLALQDANDELKKYDMFPLIKLGLMYRF